MNLNINHLPYRPPEPFLSEFLNEDYELEKLQRATTVRGMWQYLAKVRLTLKETALLKYLYHNANMVVGRDTLLEEVWGYSADVITHTLESHMHRLRQKIESDPFDPKILITKPGGYQLVC